MPNCHLGCDRFDRFPNITWGEFNVDDSVVEQEANGGGDLGYGAFDRTGSNSGREWFEVDYCTGSDYGGDLLHKSNFRVLMKLCKEALQEPDTCQKPWFVELSGGHSTFAIVLHCERTPDDIFQVIKKLDNYPFIDENDEGELEHEAQGEAWESWAEHDFKRALEKKFQDFDFDAVSGDDLYELFHHAMEESNTNWEVEGMGVVVDIDRIVKSIDAVDLPGKQGWKMDDDLDGLSRNRTSGKMKAPPLVPAWVRTRRKDRR